MPDPGDVDPEAVLSIDVPRRPIAAAPARETQEIIAISVALGRQGDQSRERCPRIGEPGTSLHAERPRGLVRSRDLEPVRAMGDQRQRPIRRHCLKPAMPSQTFDRPCRQPHGNDAHHDSTPQQKTATLRRPPYRGNARG